MITISTNDGTQSSGLCAQNCAAHRDIVHNCNCLPLIVAPQAHTAIWECRILTRTTSGI
jgi:hypothetical protein